MVTHLSKMLINGEIDENTTVYIDAKPGGQELIFEVVHDGGLINKATGAKSHILIDVPTESQRTKPSKKMNGAQWSHEDGDDDDDEYDNDMQDQSS